MMLVLKYSGVLAGCLAALTLSAQVAPVPPMPPGAPAPAPPPPDAPPVPPVPPRGHGLNLRWQYADSLPPRPGPDATAAEWQAYADALEKRVPRLKRLALAPHAAPPHLKHLEHLKRWTLDLTDSLRLSSPAWADSLKLDIQWRADSSWQRVGHAMREALRQAETARHLALEFPRGHHAYRYAWPTPEGMAPHRPHWLPAPMPGGQVVQGYKNGKRHGPYRERYPDGELRVKGRYRNGKPTGKWVILNREGGLGSPRRELRLERP